MANLLLPGRPWGHIGVTSGPRTTFNLTGRLMQGRLLVDPDGRAEDEDLRRWVDRGLTLAGSLPPK